MICLSLLICHIPHIIFHININAVFHFNQVQTKSDRFARPSLRDIFIKNPLTNSQQPAQKNSLFCVHLQDTQIFLAGKNLRYEKNDTLSEPPCGEFVAFFSCPQQIFASLEYLSVRNRTQNKLFFCASPFSQNSSNI